MNLFHFLKNLWDNLFPFCENQVTNLFHILENLWNYLCLFVNIRPKVPDGYQEPAYVFLNSMINYLETHQPILFLTFYIVMIYFYSYGFLLCYYISKRGLQNIKQYYIAKYIKKETFWSTINYNCFKETRYRDLSHHSLYQFFFWYDFPIKPVTWHQHFFEKNSDEFQDLKADYWQKYIQKEIQKFEKKENADLIYELYTTEELGLTINDIHQILMENPNFRNILPYVNMFGDLYFESDELIESSRRLEWDMDYKNKLDDMLVSFKIQKFLQSQAKFIKEEEKKKYIETYDPPPESVKRYFIRDWVSFLIFMTCWYGTFQLYPEPFYYAWWGIPYVDDYFPSFLDWGYRLYLVFKLYFLYGLYLPLYLLYKKISNPKKSILYWLNNLNHFDESEWFGIFFWIRVFFIYWLGQWAGDSFMYLI